MVVELGVCRLGLRYCSVEDLDRAAQAQPENKINTATQEGNSN
jgi:hypothetical protein